MIVKYKDIIDFAASNINFKIMSNINKLQFYLNKEVKLYP